VRNCDFNKPLRPNEGAIVGWVVILLFYFIAGVLLGAWLW
jgi:hypothetical protein